MSVCVTCFLCTMISEARPSLITANGVLRPTQNEKKKAEKTKARSETDLKHNCAEAIAK